MAFNGAGTFLINTSGQPVVNGTAIDPTVFNALTADLATGLSTCITKDGQTTPTANIPMGGYKITGLGLGTATTDAARMDNANNALGVCEGRLTLTSGTPVTTSDVTGAETLYYCPYKGNRIALYDGTNWVVRSFSELSIDVPDATNVYDVFAYDNSGTVTLELTAWTNTTTRATALTTQNGVYVKTGALTRRYLGSFYSTTAGNGQIDDSSAVTKGRYLWNYYNRVARPFKTNNITNWNYTTATIRQANNSTTNQLNYVVGVIEDPVTASLCANVSNTSVNINVQVGFGNNSTTTITGDDGSGYILVAGQQMKLYSHFNGYPSTVGLNYLAWLEYSAATGTTSWALGGGLNGIVYG